MSIKSKVFAATAALTLVGGVGAAGTLSASAATPSCGPGYISTSGGVAGCIDVFSRQFGTHRTPGFVMDVFRQGAKVGQPIILYRTSISDPAEDFTISDQGTVADFFAAGLVTATTALHFGGGACINNLPNCVPGTRGSTVTPNEPAFELEYSPFGVNSGMCVGVATTAVANEGVTLQPCGVSAKTVWILDTFDQGFPRFFTSYFPAINGSNTNFSHPFVLTYPANGFPTDRPRPQLKVTNLSGFSNGFGPVVGTIPDIQRWGADFGILR